MADRGLLRRLNVPNPNDIELRMDAGQLYREEYFTDHKIGTIRQLISVKSDGSSDPGRAVVFTGQTQILTAGGTLPLSFEIPAATLAEAVEKFGATAKVALEEMLRELQALRREAASQLVIPEPGAASSILSAGDLPERGGKTACASDRRAPNQGTWRRGVRAEPIRPGQRRPGADLGLRHGLEGRRYCPARGYGRGRRLSRVRYGQSAASLLRSRRGRGACSRPRERASRAGGPLPPDEVHVRGRAGSSSTLRSGRAARHAGGAIARQLVTASRSRLPRRVSSPWSIGRSRLDRRRLGDLGSDGAPAHGRTDAAPGRLERERRTARGAVRRGVHQAEHRAEPVLRLDGLGSGGARLLR